MFATRCWLQCGGRGGDTISLFNADSPDILEPLEMRDIQLLWHPSSSNGSPEYRRLFDSILSDNQTLDILCLEGALSSPDGPDGVVVPAVDEAAHRASAVYDHSACLEYLLRILSEMREGTVSEILLAGVQDVPDQGATATAAETSLTSAVNGREQDWSTNTVRTGARA